MEELKDVSKSYKEARLAHDVGLIFYEDSDIVAYTFPPSCSVASSSPHRILFIGSSQLLILPILMEIPAL